MPDAISVPQSWVVSVGRRSLPDHTNRRLQDLMDRNNEGLLTESEREELEELAEWSESVSLVRAEAFRLLGKRPE